MVNLTKTREYVRILACLVLTLTSASFAWSQTLWNGTSYGMSLEQVRRAIPAAVPPASNPDRLADGAQELLRLENVDLVENKFSAAFFFRDGKLSQVTLSLDKGNSFRTTMLVFDSLTQALRAKYGKELSHRSDRGILNMVQSEWLSGRTNINLNAVGVGDNDASLNINYQVRLSREANKL